MRFLSGHTSLEPSPTAGIFFYDAEVFFHVRHDTYLPDDEGEELPDKQAGWKEATTMAGEADNVHQQEPEISKDMVELASHIPDSKAAHFDPTEFKDEYKNAPKALVGRKATGKPVKMAVREGRPTNVVSLMDALKQSLKGGGRGGGQSAERTRRLTAPRTATAGGIIIDSRVPRSSRASFIPVPYFAGPPLSLKRNGPLIGSMWMR